MSTTFYSKTLQFAIEGEKSPEFNAALESQAVGDYDAMFLADLVRQSQATIEFTVGDEHEGDDLVTIGLADILNEALAIPPSSADDVIVIVTPLVVSLIQGLRFPGTFSPAVVGAFRGPYNTLEVGTFTRPDDLKIRVISVLPNPELDLDTSLLFVYTDENQQVIKTAKLNIPDGW